MAVAAGKNAAAVEDVYPTPARGSRTDEPTALGAEVARRSLDANGVLFVLPLPVAGTVSVHENDIVVFCAHLD
jgi:hypothetical protein